MNVIGVLVVDDHPVVRDGLAGMLAGPGDLEIVGAAADGAEGVLAAQRLSPDVVLMDLQMPGLDGLAATARVKETTDAAVLVLTTYVDAADARAALAAGASGYLLKDAPRDELFAAIRSVAAGGVVLAPAVAAALAATPAPTVALTDRELQVLRLIADGASNREVGEALFIGEATVKTHLQHVYDKLGVSDRTAAVTAALRAGLLRLS